MTAKFKDGRLKLGEDLAILLTDFCAANYGAPTMGVVREAVYEHIMRRLENPEMKARYEKARSERLGGTNIVQLVSGKADE